MPMQTQQQRVSPLREYMANYGPRLQSALAGAGAGAAVTDTSSVLGQEARTFPDQPPAQAQPASAAAGGRGFREHWKENSGEEQNAKIDELEAALSKGNQTIDSAYDQLVKQLGQRPGDDDRKLSREEKGMLLMEFGLGLMANSGRDAYGDDLGAAIGATGSSVLAGHRQRRADARKRYDDSALAIEEKRADAKADLAKQSALEARSAARDERRYERESGMLAGVVTQPDGSVVGYNRGGGASVLQLPTGGPVKERPKPGSGGAGSPPRTTDRQRLYDWFMDSYGKDGEGQPLSGKKLERVKRQALAYAADPSGSTLGEAEMRLQAERSADNFMRSNWAIYRDWTPERVEKRREELAEQHYKRLRSAQDAEMNAPGGEDDSALAPGAPKEFGSAAEVEAAFKRRQIKAGDVVIVNGKRFRVGG